MSLNFISLHLYLDLLIVTSFTVTFLYLWPSIVSTGSSYFFKTFILILLFPFNIIGLIPKEWGQIGVTSNTSKSGYSIGPPADNE